MPFNVTAAAAHTRPVVIKFNKEKLTVTYNAGEKYHEYQLKAQALDQEFADLQRRLNTPAPSTEGASAEDARSLREESERAYDDLKKAMESARRRLADNLCTVIESWDLEGDLDAIKKNLSEKDRKEYKDLSGHGEIPVSGAWLDALPLPDEFILQIQNAVTANFDSGGAAGKGS